MVVAVLLLLIGGLYGMRESVLWPQMITPKRYIFSVMLAGSGFVILWFRPDKNYLKMSSPMKIISSVCEAVLFWFAITGLSEVLYRRRILPVDGEVPYVFLSGLIICALLFSYLAWREKR